jgi:hypothetical protein
MTTSETDVDFKVDDAAGRHSVHRFVRNFVVDNVTAYDKMTMMKYTISHNDDEEIGAAHEDLSEEETLAFLLEVTPYLYSVGGYDEEDDCVERLNGEEWLHEHAQPTMVLK